MLRAINFFCAMGLLAACAPAADPAQTAAGGTSSSGNANTYCHDMSGFRAYALGLGSVQDGNVISHWQPPRPVKRSSRPTIERLAHEYISLCGISEVTSLLTHLMEFPTVSDGTAPADSPPFVAFGNYLRDWAQRGHLKFESLGRSDAWEITLGTGPHNLLLLTHADVVPPGEGWHVAPFAATNANGRIIGRGAEDNKGPLACILVVMRTLASMGLDPPGRVSVLVSSNAEHDATALQEYARAEARARHTVSLDGAFPVTVAEDGIVNWYLKAPMALPAGKSSRPVIGSATSGTSATQVPSDATVLLKPGSGQDVADLIRRVEGAVEQEKKRHKKDSYRYTVAALGPSVELRVYGKSASAAYPETGNNALVSAARITRILNAAPNGAASLLRCVDDYLSDNTGRKLGLSQSDPFMGNLVVVPTALRTQGKEAHLDVTLYRPRGSTVAQFTKALRNAERTLQNRVSQHISPYASAAIGEPTVSTAVGSLVTQLTALYRTFSGDTRAQPVSTRQSTLARLFPGAVAFGPLRPGKESAAHASDEAIGLDDLQFLTMIYLDLVFQLQGIVAGP